MQGPLGADPYRIYQGFDICFQLIQNKVWSYLCWFYCHIWAIIARISMRSTSQVSKYEKKIVAHPIVCDWATGSTIPKLFLIFPHSNLFLQSITKFLFMSSGNFCQSQHIFLDGSSSVCKGCVLSLFCRVFNRATRDWLLADCLSPVSGDRPLETHTS